MCLISAGKEIVDALESKQIWQFADEKKSLIFILIQGRAVWGRDIKVHYTIL